MIPAQPLCQCGATMHSHVTPTDKDQGHCVLNDCMKFTLEATPESEQSISILGALYSIPDRRTRTRAYRSLVNA